MPSISEEEWFGNCLPPWVEAAIDDAAAGQAMLEELREELKSEAPQSRAAGQGFLFDFSREAFD